MSRLLIAVAVALVALFLVARWTGGGGAVPLAAPHERIPPVASGASDEPRTSEAPALRRELAAPPSAARAEVAPVAPVAPQQSAGPLPPLLLAGRVLDGRGAGVPEAAVRLERHVVDAGGFGMRTVEIRALPRLSARTDAEGRFEVRGDEQGEVVVRAEKEGHALREELTRTLPATGVTLVLERAGALLVTLAPGSLELAGEVRVEVRAPEGERDVLGAAGAFREGRAVRRGLLPGRYDVVVVARQDRRPLHTVPDVVVRAGETTEDLRLEGLDLRASSRRVRVTVVDPDERPLRGVTVRVHQESGTHGIRTGEDGSVALVAGAQGVDVSVQEPGWRGARHRAVTEDLVIRLQRPIALRLVRPPGRSAALGALHLHLERLLPEGVEPSGERSPSCALPADADAVEVALDAAGAYSVRWAVAVDYAGRGTGYFYARAGEPQVIEVSESAGTQQALLDLDPAAVEELRRRLGALADELVQQPDESDDAHDRRVLEVILRENGAG